MIQETSSMYLVIPPAELRKLTAQRKEFGTLEAFCIHLCGGEVTAGRMLNRLLIWWQKTTHPDGWVYKSHVDWWNELCIKRSQLPKAKGALALAGVEVQRMKGGLSSPRLHYRLNAELFIKALVRLLGNGEEWLKNFCEPFMQSTAQGSSNRLTHIAATGCASSGQSSTIVTADSSSLYNHGLHSNSDADADLHPQSDAPILCDNQEGAAAFHEESAHGADCPIPQVPLAPLPHEVQSLCDYHVESKRLPPELAREYVEKHGERRCVDAAKYALGPGVDKPAGMFRWVLDQTDWFMNTVSPVPVTPEASGKPDEFYDKSDDDDDVTEVDPVPHIDPERAAQWRSAFAQLELQLDKANFDTWLRDAQLVGFEDETFVIGVRNTYARQYLTYRLNKKIDQVLGDVVGAPVTIRYQVYTPRQRHEDQEMPLYQLVQS